MANTIISLVLKAKDEASSVLTGAFAKLTALAGAVAAAFTIKGVVEDLNEVDKIVNRLSMSTEEFSRGQYAAMQLAGVGAEQYGDALTEVRIKLEEWSSIQSGGATDFFEVMNLDVKEFMKLNPQDQMLKIAEAMKDMSASAQFTFLDQIGSDALRNLLPALRNGGEEFRKMLDQAEKFNLSISSYDAKAVRSLTAEFKNLGSISDSVFRKAFAGIAPELEVLVIFVRDKMLSISNSVDGPLKSIGDTFLGVLTSVIRSVSMLSRVKDGFDALFHGVKSGVLLFAQVFLTGMQGIENGVTAVMNSTDGVLRSSFSGFVQLVNNLFVKPIADAMAALGIDSVANKLSSVAKGIQEYSASINNNRANFQARNLQPTIDALGKMKEKSDAIMAQNIDLAINGTFDADGIVKELEENVKNKRLEIGAKVKSEEEIRENDISKGGDAKFQGANAAASAAVMATQAKLRADLAKAEIEGAMKNVEAKRDIELAGLEQRGRDENLSANKIAEMRFQIELDAAKSLSAQRQKLVQEDIKSLQQQIEAQRKILGVEQNDNARGTALSAISELEAEITRKRMEQKQIGADLVNQSALMKANRAAELGTLKAELEEIKKEAEFELRVIRGDSVGVELDKLNDEFSKTVKLMEEVGVDSTAVKDLLSSKKAQAELNEIEKQFAALKKKLESNAISPFDYMNQVKELEKKGTAQVEITGSEEVNERFTESVIKAKAEVFETGTIWNSLKDSMGTGFETAFSEWMSGTKSAKEAFSDMAQSVLMDIGKIIAKLMVQLAYQSMISAFSGGGAAAGVSGSSGLSGLLESLPFRHGGGDVPRMPNATKLGLRRDESLIIAQEGETVLTKKQQDAMKNQGGSAAPAVNVVNMLDSDQIARSVFEHSSFERNVINTLRANAEVVRSM